MRYKISIFLPDLRGGGVERIRLVLAEEFLRQGHAVEFILLKASGALLAEAEASFPVHSLGCGRVRHAPIKLARYLRLSRPDAILAAMWPFTGIAALAVRLAGQRTRLVASEHTDLLNTRSLKYVERLALKGLGRWLYAPCHRVIAVSAGVADSIHEVAGLTAGRVTVIYNPARPLLHESLSENDRIRITGWLEGDARLIAVGALKQAKGFDVLIRALADLRRHSDARLLILGEGVLREELQSIASELGVRDSVWLPGFRSNPGAFLQHAHLFVLSSNWEGFGNVIVEALSAGIPVVSTDCPSGPREILENGRYGRLTAVGDPEKLSLAISEALSQAHDSGALRARAADFSVDKIAGEYLSAIFR